MKRQILHLDSRKGFTLIEMLITVAIIGILATVAMGPFLWATDSFKSQSVAERILDILAHARTQAVELGKPVTVQFFPATSVVQLEQFDGLPPLPTEPGGYSLNLSNEYQTTVNLTTLGLTSNEITFRSDGAAVDSSGALVSLSVRIIATVGSESTRIQITSVTGLATIINE